MHRSTLPGRASLFTAATFTFIATLSLLAPPVARAAAPMRSLDTAVTEAVMAPCSQAAPVRAPLLRTARLR